MTVDEKSHSLFKVLSQMCLQAKQVQGYKQTYKVLKSNKRVCSVLSLQGEEAVSNVIKLALIFENGSSCSLSLVMGCVFELGIWIRFLARMQAKAAPQNVSTKSNNKE